MTFKNWILRFSEVKLPIGDLARDIKKYKDFPNENSKDKISDYLIADHASGPKMVTFENAWNYYLSEHGPV